MKLAITKRTGGTKGEAKAIRREGNIPAVVYGHGQNVETVTVSGAEFQAILRKVKQGQLSTTLFDLHFNGKTHKALIKDIQYNPASYAIEHLDFLMLTESQPITVSVPILILGANECPGIKLGGTLRQVIRTLKVSCLPKHIPTEFKVDIRELNVAQSKRLSDIDMPAHVRPLAPLSEVVVVIAKGKAAA